MSFFSFIMRSIVNISEIFYSNQGEGKNREIPYIFVRFAGCNLTCIWCDSKYTWHKDFLDFKTFQLFDLINEIRALSQKHNTNRILFTGGEPLLFSDVIEFLMKQFSDFFFEVETNGSIATDLPFHQINVSYKLKNAKTRYYDLKIFPNTPCVDYKFVICDEDDIHEALNVAQNHDIPRDQIYFMPEGVDPDILQKRSLWLEQKCREIGVHFSPRLHIMLFGNKRGV